jgi:maltose/moltooligosaccharide transporter
MMILREPGAGRTHWLSNVTLVTTRELKPSPLPPHNQAMLKPQLSFSQILNMNVGFFGIQYSFGLQQSNMSPIYSYLGADAAAIPLLWLAGPVTGLFVQPIVGAMSDKTVSRFGRRTPYFLIGAVVCSLGLLAMPFSASLWMAASLLWILDAGNNATMQPYRAFVSDKLDESQHGAGYLTQSAMTGLGQTLAYLTPSLLVYMGLNQDTVRGNDIPQITVIAFLIGAAISLVTILWTVRTTPENPLSAPEIAAIKAQPRGVATVFKEIALAARDMPSAMKQLAPVMLLQWYAFFAYWQFITLSLAQSLFQATDAATPEFRAAALVTGHIGAFYNFVAFCAAIVMLPVLRKVGVRLTHALCLVAAGLGMLYLPAITREAGLYLPMIGIGLAWASIMANPFVIVAKSVPPERTGVYMGLFNAFIVLPMILYNAVLGGQPQNVIRLCGVLLLLAALSMVFVKGAPRPVKSN